MRLTIIPFFVVSLYLGGILFPMQTHGQGIPSAEQVAQGPVTGLPIPRFVALKVNEARMRSQPSTNHAILFIYLRIGLPMKVLEERGDWRRVEDHEGFQGWMKNTILTNNRGFRITVPLANLHARSDLDSTVRAELEEGVIGDLTSCRVDGWCRANIQNVSGWLRTENLWGVLPREEF